MDYKITNKAIDKLKYDLVREGLLDYNQLVDAIELSREQQTNLGHILIQDNIISESILLNFLEQKLHIPYVNLDDYTIDVNTIRLITKEEAEKYKIIPLFIIEDTLTIAMADPLDLFVLNNLNISSNYKVEPVICSERSIVTAINVFYNYSDECAPSECQVASTVIKDSDPKFNWQSELNEDNTDDVNIYRLVRAIIYQALHERASDIHFDPQQDELLVRFRIDDMLHNRGIIPILLSSGFTKKIKSAAGLDINEGYFPQHGRIEVNVGKNNVNARVSTFPINYGEKIVIKIFPKAPSLNELGFENEQLETLKTILKKESGLIIASGPLGSGQTTTMYSILEHINNEHKNIMTIESPIRYNIDRINQSQINSNKNFNLEVSLKNIFLQEPDVIYIDDITDFRNIELLINAALAGHLILTTITSDSAIGILYKLIAQGVNPKLLKKIVNLTFSQKLIRCLCSKCKKETKIDSENRKKYNLHDEGLFFEPNGCKYCYNTGYSGRVGIYEFVTIDEAIENQLLQGLTEREFKAILDSSRHKTLLDSALNKVKEGITDLNEIKRVINV